MNKMREICDLGNVILIIDAKEKCKKNTFHLYFFNSILLIGKDSIRIDIFTTKLKDVQAGSRTQDHWA